MSPEDVTLSIPNPGPPTIDAGDTSVTVIIPDPVPPTEATDTTKVESAIATLTVMLTAMRTALDEHIADSKESNDDESDSNFAPPPEPEPAAEPENNDSEPIATHKWFRPIIG